MSDPVLTPLDQVDRILGEEISGPSERWRAYIPVALDGLIPETVLGFRLFGRSEKRYVLVHGREPLFTAGDRERLLSLKQPTVYVAAADAEAYQIYLESHLKEIVLDRDIPEPVKAGLVYRSARWLVREILERPDDPSTLRRSQQAAAATVDYILRGRESFFQLIQNCSIDYRTYTHSVHVCIFTVALAQRVGYPIAELPALGSAVLLHDIGKTRVDREILNKSGPLSAEEWVIMRKHPEWGAEILEGREGVTPELLDIVLHHHEKLDGSGYPHGLRGSQISTRVRMVTICDIFDAITTNRSYKSALSTFNTLTLMEREMRGQVDFDLLVELVLLLRSEG
jgi:putative nucleotidyltransferase with HDIG domain